MTQSRETMREGRSRDTRGAAEATSQPAGGAVQLRALAGAASHAEGQALLSPGSGALRPGGPVDASQQVVQMDMMDDVAGAAQEAVDSTDVGRALREPIEAAQGHVDTIRGVLSTVSRGYTYFGDCPPELVQALGQQMDELSSGLGRASQAVGLDLDRIPGVERARDVVELVNQVNDIRNCMRRAAAIPIDLDSIADNPDAVLAGYTQYFEGAAQACELVGGRVPVLRVPLSAAAAIARAIPNAVMNMHAVFARHHERIDAAFEQAQHAGFETPGIGGEDREEAVRYCQGIYQMALDGRLESGIDTILDDCRDVPGYVESAARTNLSAALRALRDGLRNYGMQRRLSLSDYRTAYRRALRTANPDVEGDFHHCRNIAGQLSQGAEAFAEYIL